MNPRYLIPVLWVRLVVLAGFGIFIWLQGMRLLAAFSVLFVVLTAVQLVIAYRQR